MDNMLPADRERIEALVADFRRRLEHLYEMAYIQGQIDQSREDSRKLKEVRNDGRPAQPSA